MRRGLLGKGALLTVTSKAARTSPVTRGKWFLQTFLGVEPAGSAAGRAGGQARARRRQRPATPKQPTMRADAWSSIARTRPARRCHKIFEPMGLALENFDAVGAWRTAGRGHARSMPAGVLRRRHEGRRRRRACATSLVRYSDQFVRVVDREAADLRARPRRRVRRTCRWCGRSCATRRRSNYRFSSLVLGIVKSAPFQMNMKTADGADATARGSLTGESHDMFITKKHIPGGPFLRGAGATLALPLLDAMVPAATALAQTAATPEAAIRRPASCRTAWRPGYWVPEHGGRAGRASCRSIFKPLEPFREADGDPERPAFALGRAASGRDRRRPLGGGGVPVREQAEEDRRRRRLRRHDDRPDDRAEDRPGQPDAVDAAGRRGSGRELEQLRRGLQLHLHQHASRGRRRRRRCRWS